MNTPEHDIIVREHQFYVSISKHVFTHPEHGIVFVRNPISLKDAGRQNLSPTILYGISVADLQIRWLMFSQANKPRSLCDVLQEAWRMAPGLRGRPHRLKINRHVTTASPTLGARLAQIGVQLVVADRQDKVFPTGLRNAQKAAMWLSLGYGGHQRIDSLASLHLAAQELHVSEITSKEHLPRENSHRVKQWLALPTWEVTARFPDDLDWSSGGWLSSWDANLPPSGPRYLHTDDFDGKIWLLEGYRERTKAEEDSVRAGEREIDDSREVAKIMVACWPNKVNEIAQASGITSRQLEWYLTSQVPLPTVNRSALLSLLGVEIEGRSGCYEAIGPYVLIASAANATKDAYNHLSHGGDLAFSFEAIPRKMPADPSWRYLLFQSYGGFPNVIMIPRGSTVTKRFNSKLFINFGGLREIPSALYKEMVVACARACLVPQANRREMKAFVERNAKYLRELTE